MLSKCRVMTSCPTACQHLGSGLIAVPLQFCTSTLKRLIFFFQNGAPILSNGTHKPGKPTLIDHSCLYVRVEPPRTPSCLFETVHFEKEGDFSPW